MTNTLPGHASQISRLAFLPSSPSPSSHHSEKNPATLISGDEAGTLILWTPSTTSPYKIAHSIPSHTESISALSGITITSDESWILSGGSDAVVHLWRWIRRGDEPGGELCPFFFCIAGMLICRGRGDKVTDVGSGGETTTRYGTASITGFIMYALPPDFLPNSY